MQAVILTDEEALERDAKAGDASFQEILDYIPRPVLFVDEDEFWDSLGY